MPRHLRRRQLVPWLLATGIAAVGLAALGAAAFVASGRLAPQPVTAQQVPQPSANEATPRVVPDLSGSASPSGLAETAPSVPTPSGTRSARPTDSPGPEATATPTNEPSRPGAVSEPVASSSGTAITPSSPSTAAATVTPASAPAASPSASSGSASCPSGVVTVSAPVVSDLHVDPAWVKSVTSWGQVDRLTARYVTENDITWSHGTVTNGTTGSITIGSMPRVVGTIGSSGGQVSASTTLGGKPVLRAGRLVRFSGSTTGWWALENPVTTTLSGLPGVTWTDADLAARCAAPTVSRG